MVQGPANFTKHGLYGQAWTDMHKIDLEQLLGHHLPPPILVIPAQLTLTPPHHLYYLHYIPPIPPEAVVKCVAMVLTLIPM